jgi:hypothetical protein
MKLAIRNSNPIRPLLFMFYENIQIPLGPFFSCSMKILGFVSSFRGMLIAIVINTKKIKNIC